MRAYTICVIVAVASTACGRTSSDAAATSTSASSSSGVATPADAARPAGAALQVSDADRVAVLKAAKLIANAQGQVKNECDELVTPQFVPVDLGNKVGASILLVMTGGPAFASCYGDGPGLTLFRKNSGAWHEIYSSRGGSLVVMKDQHNGAPDIVFGGPGFSHPVSEWNGSDYQSAKRNVPDDRIADALILP